MSSVQEAQKLFKSLMTASQRFTTYNFREYFIRRIQHDYNMSNNPEGAATFVSKWKSQLPIIERQSVINELYSSRKSVIETAQQADLADSTPGLDQSV